jgi:hypothetical protein
MVNSLTEAIRENPERFVNYAFKENPFIKNLGEFKNAFLEAFSTDTGRNATNWMNDEEFIELWESREAQSRVKENLTEEEYQEQEKEIQKGELEVLREKRKGEQGKIITIVSPKPFKISSYSRRGKAIPSYNKGYRKWKNAEIKFLKVRKGKSIKQISYEYNKHFKENPRSESSIKTKSVRTFRQRK